MLLVPRRVKYRKQMRGSMKGVAHAGTELNFGDYGLVAQEMGWITSRQIEAARRAITHHIARGGRVWIRIFPDKPITKKPPEVRMGSGKGDIFAYVAPVKAGRVLFEMAGVNREIAQEALRLAMHKLPVKSKFLEKGK